MTSATLSRKEKLHRRGVRLEVFTITWNVIEAFVAIGVGLLVGSVALVGFGVDSGIEVISAVALLWRLLKAGPNASLSEEGAAERKALYLVAGTLFLLAAYITYEGIESLISQEGAETSTVGIILATLSILIMPTLAYLKGRTGREMGSRAAGGRLQGDVGVRLPLLRAAGRRGPQRGLRLVVGRPGRCSRHAAGDPLAGLGDPGGSSRGRRGRRIGVSSYPPTFREPPFSEVHVTILHRVGAEGLPRI